MRKLFILTFILLSIYGCGSDFEEYWVFNWKFKLASDSLNIKFRPNISFTISDEIAWVDYSIIDSVGNFSAQIGIQASSDYIEQFKERSSIHTLVWHSNDTLLDTSLLLRRIEFDSNNLSLKEFYIAGD